MSSPVPAPSQTPRRAALMIAVAAAAAFLATFNETFLNVAFTPIMADFGVDVGTVQWLTTGYLLVAAMFVPVANVLYHRFPTRGLVVSVVALMVVGSVVGALAPTFSVLLIGRLLQAVGTGLLTPLGMNVTLAVSPRQKLGLMTGIMAAMTTLGPSLAIVLSGVLLTVAHWTVLLWVFGGLTLIVLVAGALVLRTVADLGRPVLDVLSFVLVAVGLVGVLYGVSAAFGGAGLYAAGAGVIGLIALALFVRRQGRIAHPPLDLRPFASTPFVLGVAMTMLGLLFVFGMNVVIPLFLQSARGLEPLAASLTLAPGILLTVVLGPIAGRLFDRHGGRWSIPLGFLTMAVFVTLVGVAAGFDSILLFGALYVPAVLATAFIIGPAQTFALSHLDRETSPHGVTVVSTGFQIAGCVGTSLAAGIYGMLSSAGVRAGHGESAALLTGFRGAVGLVVVTSLVGIVLAVLAHRASTSARAAAAAVAEAGAAGAEADADTVDSIMQTRVHALRSDQSVLEALQFFAHHGISGAPIVDDRGSLAGYLSDGDVMRYLSAAHPSSTSIYSYAIGAVDDLEHAMADLEDLNVLSLATRDVITIGSGSSIADAVAALSDVRLKKAPVVAADGTVVGIVSRSAIGRMAIAGYLRSREAQEELAHA